MKVLVVYYSMYGHIFSLAQAIVEGARQVEGAEVELRRVPETLSDEILGRMGALEAQKAQAHVPVCTVEELGAAIVCIAVVIELSFIGGQNLFEDYNYFSLVRYDSE